MMVDSKTNLTEKKKVGCNITSCKKFIVKQKIKSISSAEKKIILKYQLRNNDKKEDYLLVNTPVYLPKSVIDEKNSLKELENFNNTQNLVEPSKQSALSKQENALERCKRCCLEGKCSLKELLEVCEKDPDSILNAYKCSCTYEKYSPQNESSEIIQEEDKFASIKMTHGEVLGDPKYHYLMVDVSTDTHSEVFPASTPEHHEEPIVEPTPSDISTCKRHHQVHIYSDEIKAPHSEENLSLSPVQSFARDEPKTRASILWSSDTDDKMSKHSEIRRQSAVSFSGLRANATAPLILPPQPIVEPVESVDKAEEEIKVDNLRHRAPIRPKGTLLGDIIRQEKKKSSITKDAEISYHEEEIEEEIKPKKFCSFLRSKKGKKTKGKKSDSKKSEKKSNGNKKQTEKNKESEDHEYDSETDEQESADEPTSDDNDKDDDKSQDSPLSSVGSFERLSISRQASFK